MTYSFLKDVDIHEVAISKNGRIEKNGIRDMLDSFIHSPYSYMVIKGAKKNKKQNINCSIRTQIYDHEVDDVVSLLNLNNEDVIVFKKDSVLLNG